jgi:hypothetical protein
MAVVINPASAGSSQPMTTFTMSLIQGWDRIVTEDGGRPLAAGDLVVLEVRQPLPLAAGPPGWVWATDRIFYKIIGPPEQEQSPMFTAMCADGWEIQGYAITGEQIELSDGSGSAVTPIAGE